MRLVPIFAVCVLSFMQPNVADAQSSGSYLDGVNDRSQYEIWFAQLTADYKKGVEFWVSNRSKPMQPSCFGQGAAPESDWMRGCLTAQRRFAPLDARRKSDPEYRLGWNSIQSPEVQQAARTRQVEAVNAGAFPSLGNISAQCSQETSSASRGMNLSPDILFQMQASCFERYRQIAVQSAQIARDAQLRAQAAQEAERRQAEQVAAEQSPDNHCRNPKFAAGLMESINEFDTFKSNRMKSVDIERLTTIKWDASTGTVICHGTFIFTNGRSLTGSLQIRPNVAGEMIKQWYPDRVGQ